MRRLVILGLFVLVGGCGTLLGFDDIRECVGNECPGTDGGVAGECSVSSDCEATAPICDPDQLACGLCEASTECAERADEAPICNDETGLCVECAQNSDCESEACNTATNACVDEALIVYADVTGSTNPTCGTKVDPCRLLQDALARTDDTRNTILARPGTFNADVTTVTVAPDTTVTFLLAGATIDLGASAPVLTIGTGATVTIVDGTVTEATGATGITCADATSSLTVLGTTVSNHGNDGISCAGTVVLENATITGNNADGVDVDGGANLSISGGVISLNMGYGIQAADTSTITEVEITGNVGGGILCAGNCTVSRNMVRSNAYVGIEITGGGTYTNNVIRQNGGAVGGSLGGVSMFMPTMDIVFQFNTVISNSSASVFSGGIHCLADAAGINSPNNLVHLNTDSMDQDDNFKGECSFSTSNVGGGAGNTNIDQLPMFINFNSYLLTGSSPCRDLARFGAAAVDVDFQGEARPSGEFPDCGADEWVP